MAEYSTFHEFVQETRFKDNGKLDQLLRIIINPTNPIASKLVVLHPPYPESERAEEEVMMTWRKIHKKANATGYGCGKTDLLALLEQIAREQNKYNIVSCLNNRELVADGVNFYTDIFLEELYKLDKSLFQSFRQRVIELYEKLRIRRDQLALLINTAFIPLATLIAFVLTLLGVDALKFFVDPNNQQLLVNLFAWIDQRQTAFWIIAFLGLVIWFLYAWGALQKDDKANLKWQELGKEIAAIDKIAEAKEKLTQDQDEILSRFATKRRPLLLLIDDVDVIDTASIKALVKLHQKADESRKYVLLTFLGYNPWNPTLYYLDKRTVYQEFGLNRVKEQGWTSCELPIPSLSDLRAWLWLYYNHEAATKLLDVLDKEYTEISENPSLALAFFTKHDRERIKSRDDVVGIEYDDIKLSFERFLNRDRRVAQQVIQAIGEHKNGDGAIEMLKYILAYKKHKVPVEHIRAVMLKTSKHKDVVAYEEILLSEELNLLKRDFVSGTQMVYVFRQPYLRSLLCTSWQSWRASSGLYTNDLFLGIHQLFRRHKDDPELALEAEPSKLSVDVLRRQGDYYYKYYGSSDAGHALRYYGLTRGGALGKWLSLCQDAIESGENLWDLIYWKSDARLNPKRYWSREADNPWVFAPDIMLTAGKLYWMNGNWETAELIWNDRWSNLFAELKRNPNSDSTLVQRVNDINVEIHATLAEMLFQVGQPGHWERAKEICKRMDGNGDSKLITVLNPTATKALIEYYQQIGLGNYLPPYRFLRPEDSPHPNNKIKKVISKIPTYNINRLRILYVISESIWQTLWDPTAPLPKKIEFTKVKSHALNQLLWGEFVQIHTDQLNDLAELVKYRNSQRYGRLPGGRIQDGDLLFWEAMIWFNSARYYCLEAVEWFDKWPLLRAETTRKMTQRFRSYYAIAHHLQDFCMGKLPDRKPSPAFAEKVYELEKINDKWSTSEDDEEKLNQRAGSVLGASFQQEKKGVLRQMQRDARIIVEELYQIGWSSMVSEAKSRLQLAESVYRQLGYQQGIASTKYARAIIDYQFRDSEEKDERPEYLDLFENYLRLNNGVLGCHLETLQSHIFIGQWASEHDLYLGVQSYLSAEKWALPANLGLPQVCSGEINYQIGQLIGNMEASPFSTDAALDVLEKAAHNLGGIDRGAKYVDYSHLLRKIISIHWWLAELYRRQAFSEHNFREKERLLEQVDKEIEYVLKKTGA